GQRPAEPLTVPSFTLAVTAVSPPFSLPAKLLARRLFSGDGSPIHE
ncbi:MAG: hypothetical protein H6656_11045, partial [Ardenticatenaceae bacterium]|nr:hypothetical protein [Ardenticatenaceae bacterium]